MEQHRGSHGDRFQSIAAFELDTKLWSGFSAPAMKELIRLHQQPTAPRGERIGAAWALARWHAYGGKPSHALNMINSMHAQAGSPIVSTMVVLVESQCLVNLNRSSEALLVLQRAIAAQGGFSPDLCLACSNCFASDATADNTRLDYINRVYRNAGITAIAKARPDEPLTIDNLALAVPQRGAAQIGSKVSVIVPVYNSVETISTAIRSILLQTWPNLEIIVVDDCSTDGTWDVICALERQNDRIVTIRQDHNQGVYSARNRGLEIASGELITTHDADDWSHPQKIETQVRGLIARPDLQGSRLHWARASTALLFSGGAWRAKEMLVALDYSSLMFRPNVKTRLGAWDRVRAAADTEFIERAKTLFGSSAFNSAHGGAPLAFGRTSDRSLTSSQETHLSTTWYGPRHDYREAARRWHKRASGPDRLKLVFNAVERPFPAAPLLLPERPPRPNYDILLVAEPEEQSDDFVALMELLRLEVAAGKRVAFFNWPRFSGPPRPLSASLGLLADMGKVDIVGAGESVVACTVLVGDAAAIQYQIDRPPKVRLRQLVVTAPLRTTGAFEPRGSVRRSIDHVLRDTFGTVGEWIPISHLLTAAGPRSKERSRHLLAFDAQKLNSQKLAWERGDPTIVSLVGALLDQAQAVLVRGQLSVVDKVARPGSGDSHDYMSPAPYWWPDEAAPGGLPFKRRDGEIVPSAILCSPESERYDRTRANRMFEGVTVLALAWHFTRDLHYAAKAEDLIRTWFISPQTRMNPHLRYAQFRFGHDQDRGSSSGLIEFVHLYYVLDAAALLSSSGVLNEALDDQLCDWLSRYLAWMRQSPAGQKERSAQNNQGLWYDLQMLAVANYVGDVNELNDVLDRARGRIGEHFAADGSQPEELSRTVSRTYCAFNLQGWANLALAAESLGVNLWDEKGANGAGLEIAFRWLLSSDGNAWPFPQILPFDGARLVPLFEIYKQAYPSADTISISQRLTEIIAPPSFHPSNGIRPYWRLGARAPTNRRASDP